ncbi:SDR family NAD(P)-dependent oxidoreductase [Streptomyces sp. NPDC058664]|uniref:SDR family NAD(P)-dependent oxidoreductase n=1 Tax=unclassified Streptomyces TaxID=2593676 RepID=UPI0036474034
MIRASDAVSFLEGLAVIHALRCGAGPFEGRTVVVTGASAGVGRATARAYGARVALLAGDGAGLEAAADEVGRVGGAPLVVPVDRAAPRAVEAAADRVESRFGPVDVWVNAALASAVAREQTSAVAYPACVNGTRAALRSMRPRGYGTIVQVVPAPGEASGPRLPDSRGAERTVDGFTAAVRLGLLRSHSRVAVTVVRLPAVGPPPFSRVLPRPRAVPRAHRPEDVARAVLYAAHHPRREGYGDGLSTTAAALARRATPALPDRYFAGEGRDARPPDVPAGAPYPLRVSSGGPGHGDHGAVDDETAAHSPYASPSRPPAAGRAVPGPSALVAHALTNRSGRVDRLRTERR